MDLPIELSKEFASLLSGMSKTKQKETATYGTVVKNDTGVYVKLDGSNMLTPVSKAMDAEDGDRVMVTVQNHKATIVGNITSPASARTATNYMKLTAEGLVVGDLGANGEPSGTHSLIGTSSYRIRDNTKKDLAAFTQNGVYLNGNEGSATAEFTTDHISLANGDAYFSSDGVEIGKGNSKAKFTSNGISLLNGKASFSPDKIKLSDGNGGATTFDANGVSLAGGKAYFGQEGGSWKVVVGSDGATSTFTPTELSLSGGLIRIDGNGVNIQNGAALLNSGGVSFNNGNSYINPTAVSLSGGTAFFAQNLLKFGNSDTSVIEMCNGKGSIKMDGGSFSIGNTEKPVGIRSIRGTSKSEVVTNAGDTVTEAALQVYSENKLKSSVMVDREGVRFSTPSGKSLYNNSYEILQSNTLLAKGRITIRGNLKAGDYKTFSYTVKIPDGYFLGGIRDIRTNHHHVCKITQFITDPSTKTVGVTLAHTGQTDFKWKKKKDANGKDTDEWESEGLTIWIEWFAFNCKAEKDDGEVVIDDWITNE